MGKINWREIFIEVALRAMRKLHIEHGMWGVGQATNGSLNWKNLNVGSGIELALETSVCAAITQEFINSPFTNGVYLERKDENNRRYEIDREVTIDGKRIDLFINRFKKVNSKTFFYKYPVLIQAKRAHYFTPDIATGQRGKLKEKIRGVNSLRTDINDLKKIREKIKSRNCSIVKEGYEDNQLRDAFLYLLYWGVCSGNSKQQQKLNEPIEFTNAIESDLKKVNNCVLRWMPIKWEGDEVNKRKPKVTEWLWVMLIEVDPLKNPPYKKIKYWFEKK